MSVFARDNCCGCGGDVGSTHLIDHCSLEVFRQTRESVLDLLLEASGQHLTFDLCLPYENPFGIPFGEWGSRRYWKMLKWAGDPLHGVPMDFRDVWARWPHRAEDETAPGWDIYGDSSEDRFGGEAFAPETELFPVSDNYDLQSLPGDEYLQPSVGLWALTSYLVRTSRVLAEEEPYHEQWYGRRSRIKSNWRLSAWMASATMHEEQTGSDPVPTYRQWLSGVRFLGYRTIEPMVWFEIPFPITGYDDHRSNIANFCVYGESPNHWANRTGYPITY